MFLHTNCIFLYTNCIVSILTVFPCILTVYLQDIVVLHCTPEGLKNLWMVTLKTSSHLELLKKHMKAILPNMQSVVALHTNSHTMGKMVYKRPIISRDIEEVKTVYTVMLILHKIHR